MRLGASWNTLAPLMRVVPSVCGGGLVVLAALFAVGCYAAPPPPALAVELGGCHPGAYDVRSPLRCTQHGDCVLCALAEGAGETEPRCGRLELRSELLRSGAPCPRPSACDAAQAACCEGRCVVSIGPPPL